MRVLGIDPAASCGWCVMDDSSYVLGGTEVFNYPSAKETREGAPKGRKWLDFRNWFRYMLDTYKPDVVVVEDVKNHSSTKAGHSYGFFRYDIEATCAEVGIPFEPLHIGSWKKWSTGKGNAKKELVEEKMTIAFPNIEWVTYDHSDATAMAWYASSPDFVPQ